MFKQFLSKTLLHLNYAVPEKLIKYDAEEADLLKKNIISMSELIRVKNESFSTARLFNKEIEVTDPYWYLHSLKEIFAQEVYKFHTDVKKPYFLDCGSNMGLSVIYLKRQYPGARIVAFEPDPKICSTLQHNLEVFGFTDVKVENKGIWTENTTLTFNASGGLGGRIDAYVNSNNDKNIIKIDTVRLRDYLNETVDFLKMDIEGAEFEVLKDCKDLLGNVKHLFVEYHGAVGAEQPIDEFLSILRTAGFRIYILDASNNMPLPYLRKDGASKYDLQLNIFGYRV